MAAPGNVRDVRSNVSESREKRMPALREVHADGWRVRLDLTHQILCLETPEHDRSPAPLLPAAPPSKDGPVSAATLLLKAKHFDDGLYAAVDLAAQHGAGRFPGKSALLRSLAATLSAAPTSAAALIHAACELGGVSIEQPALVSEAVRAVVADFLRNALASKPLGFYTWTPELSAIFRQDRLLQTPLETEVADALDRALEHTPGAREARDACLRLNARLTNPAKPLGIRDAGKRPPLFPASRSHEVSLFERLYEDTTIPDSFDLMTELIRRVRSGDVSLEPADDAGWYDRQTWSLEPLIVPDRMPERGRLELGKRYRKHLEDLFRGTLALARETHVKQGGWGGGGYGGVREQPIWIDPGLSVEPLPSLYARRAACYRFVQWVLEEAFGADAVAQMHRLHPGGQVRLSLAEELDWMRKLFEGAAATACRELGHEPALGRPESADVFAAWRKRLAGDADVSRDSRMMVPVFYDEQREKIKVWALLGWKTVSVSVSYRAQPVVLGVAPVKTPASTVAQPPVMFRSDSYDFASPVVAEVYVTRLLDRDEFRRHCDRYRTHAAILANLR
jgi:hypothetical protein